MADAKLTPEQETAAAVKAAQEQKTAEVKELMKRFGLKKAAVDKEGNVHFDAEYIKGLAADSLTLITLD